MPDSMTSGELLAKLLEYGFAASRRGSDKAEFVFAEHRGRAIEASEAKGRWWVEFWEEGADEFAAPVSQSWHLTGVEAIRAICNWLKND